MNFLNRTNSKYNNKYVITFLISLLIIYAFLIYLFDQYISRIQELFLFYPLMKLKSKYIYDDYSDAIMRLGDKPCVRLRRILKLKDLNCNETCLAISTESQYGNCFISFLSALAIARGSGMKRIVIKENFLHFTKFHLRRHFCWKRKSMLNYKYVIMQWANKTYQRKLHIYNKYLLLYNLNDAKDKKQIC